ncbi:MAG: dTDP-4-amino-4,6-dideoxygalactose transaminase, partial [Patiriisocius sp.]
GVSVFKEPTNDFYSNHWLSCILIDKQLTNLSSEHIRLALNEENIESRPLWKPMHLQPIFKDAPYYGDKVAENLFSNGLCLPSGSNLTLKDQDRIEKVFKTIL